MLASMSYRFQVNASWIAQLKPTVMNDSVFKSLSQTERFNLNSNHDLNCYQNLKRARIGTGIKKVPGIFTISVS